MSTPFWEEKALDELSDDEWESLCDGCGRCCLHKLEDEDTGEVHYTDVACRLLDTNSCRCKDYEKRFEKVSDCLSVRPITAQKLAWLPPTCAYKVLAEGGSLANWHPLISQSKDSVHAAGIGIAGRCSSETQVPVSEWPMHLIEWSE